MAFIPRLWANWMTLLGSVMTTVSGLAIALFLVVDLIAPGKNPYSAGFVVLALPAFFAIGLALIPVGLFIDRRGRKKTAAPPSAIEVAFETAMSDRSARNRILFVATMTVLNVVLL